MIELDFNKNIPEQLYDQKNQAESCNLFHLEYFLMYQVYSVAVLKNIRQNWYELKPFFKQMIPPEIQNLIFKTKYRFFYLSDKQLKQELNTYLIKNAIQVLSAYQNCNIPLTQDPTVAQNRQKLTSAQGDEALKILQTALDQGQFSDALADLAIRSSHKFLFDPRYYHHFSITSETAQSLLKSTKDKQYYLFPILQITKGCMNHCSHCDVRAKPHLSHMPWPIFTALFRTLHQEYFHYPQANHNRYFGMLFADSDPIAYQDQVIKADSGDIFLWLKTQNSIATGGFLTRGVTGDKTKLALAKCIWENVPIQLSLVQTSQENMDRMLKQFNATLDTIQSVDSDYKGIVISYMRSSGIPVPFKMFRNFEVQHPPIHAFGRAKELPKVDQEVLKKYNHQDCEINNTIEPDGQICYRTITKDREIIRIPVANLFHHQSMLQLPERMSLYTKEKE